MSGKFVLGIDPGLDGALALIGNGALHVTDMPTYRITTNEKKRRQLDDDALARFFDLHGPSIALAVIEDPHAMPSQGVSSSFKFGANCGVIRGLVAAHFIPRLFVRPNHWKKHYRLTADKDASRRMASQLLPKFAHLFAREQDDGRAEAVLIGLWGAKQ